MKIEIARSEVVLESSQMAPILSDILVIFGLSIGVLISCHRIGIPVILGYLAVGILGGPYCFGLIQGMHQVEVLAEIGVVSLLFTIGIEFSLEKILEMRFLLLGGGSLQVIFTLIISAIAALFLGYSPAISLFHGFFISMSSTAIVMKILQESGEVDSPHGRASLAILIFQDIIAVPFLVLLPILSGKTQGWGELAILFPKLFLLLLFVYCSMEWAVPWILYQIAKTRSREIFIVAIIFICLFTATISASFGLSLPLGAFLAGLILSRSEFALQALSNIIPFRDVFTSFFFVSVGMLFDYHILFTKPFIIGFLLFGTILMKTCTGLFATRLLGFPIRTALLTGIFLSQIGEFSFVLFKAGLDQGLIATDDYQLFIAVTLLSMVVTPFLIKFGYPFVVVLLKILPSGISDKFGNEILKDHLIIVGYGPSGKNVALAANKAKIPYVVIESNPRTVKNEKLLGEPIFFGDASEGPVLEHAGILNARVLVIGVPDVIATRMIVENTRKINKKIHIIARTPFIKDLKILRELGVDQVIPIELEASVEIFIRVLQKYHIPDEDIAQFTHSIRENHYQMFRETVSNDHQGQGMNFHLPDFEIKNFGVSPGSIAVGRNLKELNLRREFSVTVLAILRKSLTIEHPDSSLLIEDGDILITLGKPENILRVSSVFTDKSKTGSFGAIPYE